MASNPLRAERTFPIGDSVYILKPSFDALARIESALNRSIFAVIQDLSAPRTCRISDIVAVLEAGIQAGLENPKNAPSRLELGKHVQAVGLGKVLPIIVPWLSDAIATDEDIKERESQKAISAGEA